MERIYNAVWAEDIMMMENVENGEMQQIGSWWVLVVGCAQRERFE